MNHTTASNQGLHNTKRHLVSNYWGTLLKDHFLTLPKVVQQQFIGKTVSSFLRMAHNKDYQIRLTFLPKKS